MAEHGAALLTDKEKASVLRPIEQARTLPARAYFAEDFYQAERQNIFIDQWVGLCTDAIVANVGDCEPVWIAEIPLLVVRKPSGEVGVFHNIGPYDGCPVLLETQKGADTINAAYHGWQYDLDGKLVGAPYWNGLVDDDRSSIAAKGVPLDLIEVSSAVFACLVFVNISGTAKLSFAEFIAPMRASLEKYNVDRFNVGFNPETGNLSNYPNTLRCNWKTFLENDDPNIYHEGFVHAGYRDSSSVPRCDEQGRKTYTPVVEERQFGFTFHPDTTAGTYPDFPDEMFLRGADGKPVTDLRGFIALYPNVCYAMSGPQFRVALILPMGAGETNVTEFFCYDVDVARDPAHRYVVEKLDKRLLGALAEDMAPCEQIHAARHSPAAPNQRFFSPFWDEPLHALAKRLVTDIAGGTP
ncbi:MAG: Rieske 2Fe-2S domain-containing protein [Rhodospirillaceae bacterium]|jgi:choline monooxygenase|nr:Rieske 2Fe-2S domain-containing protein [Rhodospirillaceae bacterium]